jgi:hypothetical protein
MQASNVAKWNGTAWSSLGGGLSTLAGGSSVSAIAVDSTGNLYAGGAFTTASLTQVSTTTTAGSNMITLPSVAGLEIDMSCLNFTSYPVEITEINTVTNVVTLRNAAITTGPTTLSFYWPRNYISKWNGSSWQQFDELDNSNGNPQETDGQISALMIDNSGNLYAGGNFTIAGATPGTGNNKYRPFLAKWIPWLWYWF